MLRFELKKVLSPLGGRIALGLLAALTALSVWLAVSGVEWVNEAGQVETGFAAIGKLRAAQRQWSGYLDEPRLEEILRENRRIAQTPEAQSRDYRQNDIAYGWRQGFRPVLDMVNYAYSPDFQEYDWYRNETVTPDQAPDFYPNRGRLLEQWLRRENSAASDLLSRQEQAYVARRYDCLETPIYYTYFQGWEQLLYRASFLVCAVTLIVSYLAAGIFAGEFRCKADAVFFTARYGRDRAVKAKVRAGFVLITGLYWGALLIYSLLTLGILGFDGGNCPLQLITWKSFYNLKLWQVWVLTAAGGYIGALFFGFVTMCLSAGIRSGLFPVTAPFLLIFLPSFLDNLGIDRLSKCLGLLPDQLLQVYQALRYFNVYDLGGTVVSAMTVLFVLYPLLLLLLPPTAYRTYIRKEIG